MDFRLFLSSTFAEFHELRDQLKTGVFENVQRFCAQRGATFDAVDLRWGVTTDVANAQRTVPVCLAEVDRCASRGVKPCFLLLIASRSGSRPLPGIVGADDFAQLLDACNEKAEATLISEWYHLDGNLVPPGVLPAGQERRRRACLAGYRSAAPCSDRCSRRPRRAERGA